MIFSKREVQNGDYDVMEIQRGGKVIGIILLYLR